MIQAPASSSWFQHISRGVAVTVSTGAALVSIVTALYSYGVVGRSETHQSIGNVGAAWVRVRPAADTATAIGDTIRFAATIADRKGSVLIGAAPTWTIGDSTVAAIASDGSVIARGPGATTVSVVVGSIVTTAHVVVRPEVASVLLEHPAGDSAATLLEGAQLQLQARPMDARGHLVAGRTLVWHSDDSTIATVDPRGVATGQNAGRGMMSVRVDGVSAATPVVVVMTAAGIAAVAGNEQHTLAGHALPQHVVVRATNRKGMPAPGKLVTFKLRGAQGRVDPATAVTDADGRARTQWTLGDDPGRQALLASVEHLDSTAVVFAEAEPVSANTRVAVLAEHVRAPAGTLVGDSVAVRVNDSTGRALPGVPVRWEAVQGTVAAVAARTDSTGVASARWTLAPTSGTQRLRAFVGATDSRIAPVVIAATALSGPPARTMLVSGDHQRAAAGAMLASPVVVRVVDAKGNGAAGAAVSLAASLGEVRDTALTTDSLGFVRTRWAMGHSAGDAVLAVRVAGVEKLLRVNAHATPARPANLSFDDVPGARGSRVGERRLIAMVADVYGNPVADAKVTFRVKSGAVTPARAVTDAHGRISLRWTMGSSRSGQPLSGTVAGTDVTGAYLAQLASADASRAVGTKARKTLR